MFNVGDIITAIITGGLALIGVIITNSRSNQQIEHKLEVNQAIMNTKLDTLMTDVKNHNASVQQIPVIQEQIKNLDQRVHDLENM